MSGKKKKKRWNKNSEKSARGPPSDEGSDRFRFVYAVMSVHYEYIYYTRTAFCPNPTTCAACYNILLRSFTKKRRVRSRFLFCKKKKKGQTVARNNIYIWYLIKSSSVHKYIFTLLCGPTWVPFNLYIMSPLPDNTSCLIM